MALTVAVITRSERLGLVSNGSFFFLTKGDRGRPGFSYPGPRGPQVRMPCPVQTYMLRGNLFRWRLLLELSSLGEEGRRKKNFKGQITSNGGKKVRECRLKSPL